MIPRDRLAKLQAVARDQAGTPEGASAARLAARYLERFHELEASTAPPVERVVATRHRFDSILLTRVAAFLEVRAFRVGRKRPDGKGVRWREGLELRGPADLVELAVETYQDHRDRLDQVLEWAAVGYLEGAIPLERPVDAPEGEEPPAELLAVALGAMAAGAGSRPSETVPEARRLAAAAPQLED